MRSWKYSVLALTTSVVLGLAGMARAEATIGEDLKVTILKGRKFIIEATVTMRSKGTVTLSGTVGGKQLDVTKTFKTKAGRKKTKVVRFTVNPKKHGLRDLDATLTLSATVTVAETVPEDNGEGEEEVVSERSVEAAIPPPLMIIPGTTNELTIDGTYTGFRDRLNTAAGGAWITTGKRATIKIVNYQSLSIGIIPRETFGQEIAKATRSVIKKSMFARVDVVSHSMGGLIVRQAMVPLPGKKKTLSLAGQVRHVFFMGVPQEGMPVTYLAFEATRLGDQLGLDPADVAAPILDGIDNPALAEAASLFLNPAFRGLVESLLPTYAFATVPNPLGDGTIDVTVQTLTLLTGSVVIPPLTGLNARRPDGAATYHALNYTDVAGVDAEVETLAGLDLTAFVTGGLTDLSTVVLVDGPGDGVVPLTSALMESTEGWTGVLKFKDLGSGAHSGSTDAGQTPAYWNDENVSDYVLEEIGVVVDDDDDDDDE